MIVKGNKVLASARRRIRHVTGETLKSEITAMLQHGGTGTCNNIEVEQLRMWCGMRPLTKGETLTFRRPVPPYKVATKKAAPNKKKPPVKKAAMKKGADPTKKRATVKKKAAPKSDNIQKRGQAPKPKNGGAGRGQGRKQGAATTKTRKIADDLAKSDEMTPLEYMLQTLRETPEKLKAQHEAGDLDTIQYTLALSQLTSRRDDAAKNAASYIHPRLSSIEANVGLKGQDLFAALLEKER
jgi:hypothetical protein